MMLQAKKHEFTTADDSEAAAFCADACGGAGFCCNDASIGSNQYISCAQACMMRARGAGNAELHTSSGGVCGQDRTCSTTVGDHQYGHCGGCTDVVATCPHGVQNTDACDHGASLTPPGAPLEAMDCSAGTGFAARPGKPGGLPISYTVRADAFQACADDPTCCAVSMSNHDGNDADINGGTDYRLGACEWVVPENPKYGHAYNENDAVWTSCFIDKPQPPAYFLTASSQTSCSDACIAQGKACDLTALIDAAQSVAGCKEIVNSVLAEQEQRYKSNGDAWPVPEKSGQYRDSDAGCTYNPSQTGWAQVMKKTGEATCDAVDNGINRYRVCACL